MTDSIHFDRAADYYDETRGFPDDETADRATALMARTGGLDPASRVLEIGIGTGRVSLPFSQHVGAVFGVDLSRRMMERLLEKREGQPVHPVQADATRLPYPAGAFDAAVAVHVFHLIPAYQKAVAEVARVLKPGGVLILAGNRGGTSLQKEVRDRLEGSGQVQDVGVSFYERENFLEGLGWHLANEPQTMILRFTHTPQEMMDHFTRRRWSRTWRMTDEEIEQTVEAMREVFLEEYGNLHEPVEVEREFIVRAYHPPPHKDESAG